MNDERYVTEVSGIRKGVKGDGQSPCELKIGVLEGTKLGVVRAVDKSGTASIVMLVTPEDAQALANGFSEIATELGAGAPTLGRAGFARADESTAG
jgi:hypothetical protein